MPHLYTQRLCTSIKLHPYLAEMAKAKESFVVKARFENRVFEL